MVFSTYGSEPLAQQAVLDHDIPILKDVVETAKPLLRMVNGWQLDPIELARYLGKKDLLEVIAPPTEKKFTVHFEKGEKKVNQQQLGELFGFHYWPSLYFSSYSLLKKTVRNCPYLYRSYFFGKELWQMGLRYRGEIETGCTIQSSVRWVDSQVGYGLFAEEPIDKGEYIGEYAGQIRPLSRIWKDHNPFCFQYPTRFCSFHFFVIDAKDWGNELRFMNHSSTPNVEPKWVIDRGLLHLIFVAKKPIRKGTELRFDYGPDFWRKKR